MTDNINGFLIDNSAQALASKIRSLYNQPDVVKAAGINASKTIARSWEDVAVEVNDRYNFLMQRK